MTGRRLARTCERAAERYRRDQALIDRMVILSVVLLMVIAVLAILVQVPVVTIVLILAAGFCTGFGAALVAGLAIGARELRRREKGRKNP